MQVAPDLLRCKRPDLGTLVGWIADHQRLHELNEALLELFSDQLVDDEALRRDA
jgi:hypothetical protein